MFGRKARRATAESPAHRDRLGAAVFLVLGPASVEGAIQGHSPEARAHWKHRVEVNKLARREARLRREAERSDG